MGGGGGGRGEREREREATEIDYIMLATKTTVTKTEPKLDAIVSVHLKTHERFLFIQDKTICKCIHQICLLSRETNRLAGILQGKDFKKIINLFSSFVWPWQRYASLEEKQIP